MLALAHFLSRSYLSFDVAVRTVFEYRLESSITVEPSQSSLLLGPQYIIK